MPKITKEKMESMKLGELRALAKEHGVNTAGKRPSDIIVALEKKLAGGDKPAPKEAKEAKPAPKAETKPAKEAKPSPVGLTEAETKLVNVDLPVLKGQMQLIVPLIVKLCEFCEVPLPVEWSKTNPVKPAKAPAKVEEPDEEEDEEDEDEPEEDESDDEDEETDEEPEEADEEEDEEEDEDEEDEDEEDGEDLEISAEELATANYERLTEIAEKINESGVATIELPPTKSPRVLRERIREVLNEHAEKVDEDEEDEKPAKKTAKKGKKHEAPEWLVVGAKAEVEMEDDGWVKCTIHSVDEEEGTVEVVLLDGTEAEGSFSDVRPRSKAKTRE